MKSSTLVRKTLSFSEILDVRVDRCSSSACLLWRHGTSPGAAKHRRRESWTFSCVFMKHSMRKDASELTSLTSTQEAPLFEECQPSCRWHLFLLAKAKTSSGSESPVLETAPKAKAVSPKPHVCCSVHGAFAEACAKTERGTKRQACSPLQTEMMGSTSFVFAMQGRGRSI